MTINRSPNLDEAKVDQILQILDGWSGKLSWGLLIESIEQRLRSRYTRQALFKRERIRLSFIHRKKKLAESDGNLRKVVSPELQATQQTIARLKAENDRLKMENNALLEQFARWAYNSHTRGLDLDFLNRSLPAVNRGKLENKPRTYRE